MKRCREEGVPMDDVRAGDGQSTDEKASSLARVLAEYFEELNFEHPDPLPPLPGKMQIFCASKPLWLLPRNG